MKTYKEKGKEKMNGGNWRLPRENKTIVDEDGLLLK